MKFSLEDPAFLTILLIAVALFLVVLISLAVYLVFRSRQKTEEAKLEQGKTRKSWRIFPPPVPGMKESFRAAMQRLREKLPGWNHRYDVPWYALIGEEGSGKTTLAEVLSGRGQETVSTELSPLAPRWLLLDQAVLIDLPGKAFFASDSQMVGKEPEAGGSPQQLTAFPGYNASLTSGQADRTAWQGFLRLTARYRPQQPLNGIVLTIPAPELLAARDTLEDPRRVERVAELAARLDDIANLLGLNLPVYVLVTKCDVISGFSSYSRSFLEQAVGKLSASNGGTPAAVADDLFGWSNPHVLDRSFTPEWVDEAFDDTNEVLLRRQLEMLSETKTTLAADGVFLFPFELQTLRAPLRVLLDKAFRPTAYHSPHLLRGIYFCGREALQNLASEAPVSLSRDRDFLSGVSGERTSPVLYVRHLFEVKVFPERYLATPIATTFFSRNRSVMIAQIAACVLIVLLGMGSIHAWNRLRNLEQTRIQPVLQSLSASLDSIAVSSGVNVTPAVDLFNVLGTVHENEYYSAAMPYSYVDLEGLHRNLRDTLERTFEIVVLRSCKFALESRIATVLNSNASQIAVPNASSRSMAGVYPPGNAWATDPAYLELGRYISDLKALHTNIGRYQVINNAGSGSFKQLNELLHYLGGRDLPDSSRFAQDANYQRLLLNATWQPIVVPPDYDDLTASATKQRIAEFYLSWFDANPLLAEVQTLSGKDALQGLTGGGANLSNEQIRSIVSQAQAIDGQLKNGSYDWVAQPFNRLNYPALGAELDAMPFADGQFTDAVSTTGAQKLNTLKAALQSTPAVLGTAENRVRLDEEVRTAASVLDALLGYEIMADGYESSPATGACRLISAGAIWNQSDLAKALDLETMRSKIASELLPGLPGRYRDAVQRLVDRRAANAISVVLLDAAVANPNQADKQAALQTELQNFDQSSAQLKQIANSLARLHATAEESCLVTSLSRQAGSLLLRINQQLPALYPHGTLDRSDHSLPVSFWLYGVSSPDDLQAYLASERQQIETLSAEAAPLVQWLYSEGGHSETLTRWRSISQDVDAFQARKPGNPMQALETFITTDLDKITPAAACQGSTLRRSSDVFLSVRANLSNIAVAHCEATAVSRFNEITVDFNNRLAGKFPFSKLVDTRSGSEADPSDIAKFYQTVDRDSPGLPAVLPIAADRPNDAISFLDAIAAMRPLVLGSGKDPSPALGAIVHFRTNRSREVYGNRIARWNFQIGQQSVSGPPDPGEGPPVLWHFGDPVELSLRYANNSPETPATANPSPAAQVEGKTVAYRYSDPWSLFSLFRDHPPASTDQSNQYKIIIPNSPLAGSAAQTDTVVYIQIDLLPIGAKPGADTLPNPAFPFQAPTVALKPAHGE